MLSPEDISSRAFLVSLRGYDRDEVRALLAQVAEDVTALQQQVADVEARAAAAEQRAAEHERRAQSAEQRAAEQERRAQEAEDALRRADADRAGPVEDAHRQAERILAEAEAERRELDQAVAQLTVARDRIAAELRQLSRSVERSLTEAHVAPGTGDALRDSLADVVRRNVAAGDPMDASVRSADPADARAAAAAGGPADAPDPAAPGLAAPGPGPAAVPGTKAEATTSPAAATGFAPGARLAPAPDGDERDAGLRGSARDLRAAALDPRFPELLAALRAAVARLHADLADRLRAAGGRGHPSDFLLPPDAAAPLAAGAEPVLAAAWRAGLAAGATLAGADPDAVAGSPAAAPDNPDGLDDPLAAELAGAAADELADALAHALRVGLDAEEGLDALLARVDGVVAEVAGEPLAELAGLTLLRTYEEALLAAWQVGGTARRRWALAAEPGCPDPRCPDNHRAGPVPLDEPFPSGHRIPPLRGGCNCTTVPEIPISEPAS